jgi:hypothetical protein
MKRMKKTPNQPSSFWEFLYRVEVIYSIVFSVGGGLITLAISMVNGDSVSANLNQSNARVIQELNDLKLQMNKQASQKQEIVTKEPDPKFIEKLAKEMVEEQQRKDAIERVNKLRIQQSEREKQDEWMKLQRIKQAELAAELRIKRAQEAEQKLIQRKRELEKFQQETTKNETPSYNPRCRQYAIDYYNKHSRRPSTKTTKEPKTTKKTEKKTRTVKRYTSKQIFGKLRGRVR